jgi:hypothetical protein
MRVIGLLVVLALCSSALGAGGALVWSYAADNVTMFDSMWTSCIQAPLWNLNVCNRSCLTCLTGNAYRCASCRSEYVLSNNFCQLDNSFHSYTYVSLLGSLDYDSNKNDIARFYFTTTGQIFNKTNIVAVCQTNTYEFFMAGLFQPTDRVGLTLSYKDNENIDQIIIRFNLLSVIQNVTLYIQIGNDIVYTKTFNYLSDLVGTYSVSSNSTNLLIINALTALNA